MKKYIAYLAVFIIVYFLFNKWYKRKKLMSFFKDMGFGDKFLNKFTNSELFTAKNYIVNYTRKGLSLTPSIDEKLYYELKQMNDKWLKLSGIKLFTNIN